MCLSKSKGQHYKREKDDLNMNSGNRLTVLMSLDAFPCTGIDIIDMSSSVNKGNFDAFRLDSLYFMCLLNTHIHYILLQFKHQFF